MRTGRKVEPMPLHYLAVYHYICEYKTAHDGQSPSMRQMMQCLPSICSSTSQTTWILDRLEREGLIRRDKTNARAIMVVGGRWIPPQKARGNP